MAINKIKVNDSTYTIEDTTARELINKINEDLGGTETKVQELENDIVDLEESKADKEQLKDFVTKTVDDLINYYKKSETYTQTEVNELISAIKTTHFEIVQQLPEIGEENVIYLVPSAKSKTGNLYEEYIYVNGAYELIGTTDIDLSNYYTKEEIGTLLFDYVTSNDLEETLKDYVTISMKYDFVKDGIVNNTNTLTDEEQLKVEQWLGLDQNYITFNNTKPFIPSEDYQPTSKKYVDEANKLQDEKIKELELFKFPNMTIVGTPTIQNGQVSDFTIDDYLEFPFLVDFRNRPFEINFAFTTGTNVTTQQNILDSVFGLALAIKDGHIIMAISYDGATWSNQYIGTLNIEPETTYVYKISWNGMLYKVQYFNGAEYVNDFYFASTQQPFPKQMFVGVSKLSDNYFEGSVNLNYANLLIDGNVIWSGMDDAGLSTRLATDLSNIDSAGEERIKEIAGGGGSSAFTEYKTYIINNSIRQIGNTNISFRTTADVQDTIQNAIRDCYSEKKEPIFIFKGVKNTYAFRFEAISLGSGYLGKTLQEQPSSVDFRVPACMFNDTYSYPTYAYNKLYATNLGLIVDLRWTDSVPTVTGLGARGTMVTLLTTANTDAYTPISDYNPCTKKYCDDTVASAVGNIDTLLQALDNGGGVE